MPESTYRWSSSLCVVDATGRVVREAKIASEPEALTAWLKNLGLEIAGETRRNRADLEGWRRDGAHWAL
jgi:hypothetical protein